MHEQSTLSIQIFFFYFFEAIRKMGLQGNLLIYIYILTVESFSIVDCN